MKVIFTAAALLVCNYQVSCDCGGSGSSSGCAGSGADGGTTLTCEWLAADNCWKRAADHVKSCGVDATRDSGFIISGALDDAGVCRYPDLREVRFSAPPVFPLTASTPL